MEAEAILGAIEAQLQLSPPPGISPDYVLEFAVRNREGLLKSIGEALQLRGSRDSRMVGEANDKPTLAGEPTLWGGRKGAEVDPAQVQEGHRVVTAKGEHGAITRVMRYRWRQTNRDDEISYHFDIRLNSGRETSALLPLFVELTPPKAVIPDVSFDGGKSWLAPEAAWTQVVQAHRNIAYSLEKGRRARKPSRKQEHQASARSARKRYQERFAAFRAWHEAWPQAEVEELDPRLYRLFELEGAGANPGSSGAVELAQLQRAPEDWATRWKVGDRTRYYKPGEGPAATAPPLRGSVTAIDGHQATLNTGHTVPLWMLHFDPQAPVAVETFDKPRYIIELAQEMLATDSDVRQAYPDRAAVARAVKAWLAEQGLNVRTRVGTGSMVTSIGLSPLQNRSWTAQERERLEALAPGLSIYGNGASFEPWRTQATEYDPYADYGGKGSGVAIPPEQIPRFAALLARAMKNKGQALSALGQQRLAALSVGAGSGAAESEDGCVQMDFELPEHGLIRVVCGQRGRRGVWNNLWVGSTRYGFNGRRWARRQVPPQVVLEAARERGVTAFEGGS